MKNSSFNLSILILVLFVLSIPSSCNEEQKPEKRLNFFPDFQATVNPKKAVLNANTPDDVALSISWDHASFGSNLSGVPVDYHLTICADGVQGAIYTSIITDQNSHDLTHKDLNFYLGLAGFGRLSPAKLSIKIRAKAETPFECGIADAITEHAEAIPYGNSNSGNKLTAHKPDQSTITTIDEIDSGLYQGTIGFYNPVELDFYLSNGQNNFGQSPIPNFLAPNNSTNLTVASSGAYDIFVDILSLQYNLYPSSWGILGTAAGGWSVDTDMLYDNDLHLWEVTMPLDTGKLKFRQNDNWQINFGDNDPSDNFLDQNGADIIINEAGNYEITFQLNFAKQEAIYDLKKL